MAEGEPLDKTFFYYPDANSIAMATAGSERLRIDTHGHLRLGETAKLDARLKVQGDTSDENAFALKVTNMQENNLLTVRNDGNVGIGIDIPGYKVHVEGGSVNVNDSDWSRKAVLGSTGTGVYGSGSSEGVYAISNGTTGSYGIKALSGGGAGAAKFLGEVHIVDYTQSGKLGIGTTSPGALLHVNGNAIKPGGGYWGDISDKRLKKNVKPLNGALEKLLKLRGVTFEWKEPQKQGNLTGTQIGMIAQEVEQVFPTWISEDPDGFKILSITGFEALTVEAFKELKVENENLKEKITELEARIEALEGKINPG